MMGLLGNCVEFQRSLAYHTGILYGYCDNAGDWWQRAPAEETVDGGCTTTRRAVIHHCQFFCCVHVVIIRCISLLYFYSVLT